MRTESYAIKLGLTRDRLTAIRDVLRAGHMPSSATTEAVSRLRGLAVEIDLLADDLSAAQTRAAHDERQALP